VTGSQTHNLLITSPASMHPNRYATELAAAAAAARVLGHKNNTLHNL